MIYLNLSEVRFVGGGKMNVLEGQKFFTASDLKFPYFSIYTVHPLICTLKEIIILVFDGQIRGHSMFAID